MIRWGEDLGAPAVVAAASIVTDTYKPTWSKPVGIGLAVAGYVLNYMRIGGQFTKNLGIAAAPWAMLSIYDYIKGGVGLTAPVSGGRLVMRPTGRLASSTIVSPGLARSEETVSVCKP